jgi:hypothetical protein
MKAAALENDCRRREHFVNVATAALLRTSLRRLFTNRHSHLEAVPAGVTLKVVERHMGLMLLVIPTSAGTILNDCNESHSTAHGDGRQGLMPPVVTLAGRVLNGPVII